MSKNSRAQFMLLLRAMLRENAVVKLEKKDLGDAQSTLACVRLFGVLRLLDKRTSDLSYLPLGG